jgi:carboxymethylenebutenolidase
MATSEVNIETPDGLMPAYRADPDREVRGAVVVIQEAFGVTSHIEDVTRRLAAAGWLSVAPALFHRQGSPVLDYTDFEKVMPIMGQLTAAGISEDLDATFDYLRGEGFGDARCGIVGFCMGGSVALVAGTLRPLGAAVTYYGGGVAEGRFGFPPLCDLASTLISPWLGQFGDLDKGIPVDQVEALRRCAANAPDETEIYRYADADHGFNCNDRPNVYNPDAAALAWERTLAWFDTHIAAG